MFPTLIVGTLLIITVPIANAIGERDVDFSGYEKWTPPGQQDNVLYCHDESCTYDYDYEYDRCCSCNAKRCWEINATACGDVIGQLHLEYSDAFGRAVVLLGNASVNATLYELIHTNGRLAYVPENICSFANQTISVNFANNHLSNTSIPQLKCMIKLDYLILDYNPIGSVDNKTFSGMLNLRLLSMSHCGISHIDPSAIAISQGNIFSVDFSFNDVEKLDVTNLFRNGSFCTISYNSTSATEITNSNNLTVMDNEVLGPGTINLNYTQLGSFFNFSIIGVDNYQDVPKYIAGRIYTDESSINCDCNLYPLFDGLAASIGDIWGNIFYSNFICQSPENFKGFNLSSIIADNKIDELVCDLTAWCPRFCTCIETPGRDRIVVNCSWANLTEMPTYMPTGYWNLDKIELLLDHNNIARLEDRDYLYRLLHLDMTANPVATVGHGFAANMNDDMTIEIEDQILTTLPRRLQERNPNRFVFGLHPIQCTCENTWVGNWMRFYNAENLLRCTAKDNTVDTAIISEAYLGCIPNRTGISPVVIAAISILVLIVIALAIWATYLLRYEIFLLKRKWFSKKPYKGDLLYDVFVSFKEDNNDTYSWIKDSVLPRLQTAGYSVYCPLFHLIPGDFRDRQVAMAISRSSHYVLCLCDNYQTDLDSVSEFNLMWNRFRADNTKRITVINFAPLRKRDIKDKRMKAFRRIGDDLNFKTTENKLLDRLEKRIGPPKVQGKEQTLCIEDLETPSCNDASCTPICDKRESGVDPFATRHSPDMFSNVPPAFDTMATKPNVDNNCNYRRRNVQSGRRAENMAQRITNPRKQRILHGTPYNTDASKHKDSSSVVINAVVDPTSAKQHVAQDPSSDTSANVRYYQRTTSIESHVQNSAKVGDIEADIVRGGTSSNRNYKELSANPKTGTVFSSKPSKDQSSKNQTNVVTLSECDIADVCV